MMETIYKVCRLADGKMCSYAVENPIFELHYQLNKWVTARIGGILCFSSLSRAAWFAVSGGPVPHCILQCLGHQPMKLPDECLSAWYLNEIQQDTEHNVEALWKGRLAIVHAFLSEWPIETVAYRRIKPIEVVNMR